MSRCPALRSVVTARRCLIRRRSTVRRPTGLRCLEGSRRSCSSQFAPSVAAASLGACRPMSVWVFRALTCWHVDVVPWSTSLIWNFFPSACSPLSIALRIRTGFYCWAVFILLLIFYSPEGLMEDDLTDEESDRRVLSAEKRLQQLRDRLMFGQEVDARRRFVRRQAHGCTRLQEGRGNSFE